MSNEIRVRFIKEGGLKAEYELIFPDGYTCQLTEAQAANLSARLDSTLKMGGYVAPSPSGRR